MAIPLWWLRNRCQCYKSFRSSSDEDRGTVPCPNSFIVFGVVTTSMYMPHGLPPELVSRIVQALDVSIRADLQNVRFWYFVWLLIATGAVVLGVAMEGPEVWYEFVDVIEHRSIDTEQRPPNWAKLWAAVGWMLIVLGCRRRRRRRICFLGRQHSPNIQRHIAG
jgi:hypothetical protein